MNSELIIINYNANRLLYRESHIEYTWFMYYIYYVFHSLKKNCFIDSQIGRMHFKQQSSIILGVVPPQKVCASAQTSHISVLYNRYYIIIPQYILYCRCCKQVTVFYFCINYTIIHFVNMEIFLFNTMWISNFRKIFLLSQ